MNNKNKLKALILDKLSRHTYWGGKHTDFENLQKGVPQHLKGDMKAGKELTKEGFLLPKPTSYGLHISLNPRMADEIQDFIEKNLV
ncbi:MAG TPA: hypothetical protein VI979_00175 [archaeon]|nr:hypothetical protein [archaeon]